MKTLCILLLLAGLSRAAVYDVQITTAPTRALTVQFDLIGNPSANDPATVPLVVNGTPITLTTDYATDQPIVSFTGSLDVLADTSAMADPADWLQMTVHDPAQTADVADTVAFTGDSGPLIYPDHGGDVLATSSYFDPTSQLSVAVVPEPWPRLVLVTCGVLGLIRRRRTI